MKTKRKLPIIILTVYCLYFILLAIHPANRLYWIAANISTVLICILAIATFKKFQFSNTAYILASFLLFLQTLGAHYFFYKVPVDFITDFLSFNRNHFDRVVHVSVGLYAYPFAEYLCRKKIVVHRLWVYIFAFIGILAVAAFYEILEWIYVIVISPQSNADFLGAQGDTWDAQKDMLSDGIGALFAIFLFHIKNKEKLLLS